MPRVQPVYRCQSCGSQAHQFFGRCPSCGAWNTLLEELPTARSLTPQRGQPSSTPQRSRPMAAVEPMDEVRISTGSSELDRVLGGGLVRGSLVLVGGDPGIGKSTLLLQTAHHMAQRARVLYVSAEESAQQVRLRWSRLRGCRPQTRDHDSTSAMGLNLQAETDLHLVLQELESLAPDVAVIDSIQALHNPDLSSAAGSVAQVRECAAALRQRAKIMDIAILLVGHVTKEGMLAGPKTLEHLVDAVLSFEGDRFASHRLLRSLKNRFGATFELGVFEMGDRGLTEVTNPSQLFLSQGEPTSGTAAIVACEGTRPLVVELQALVSPSSYASPRRSATGIANNRLHQILAVLEKQLGLPLSRFDCYLAVAGGLEVTEPAADVGVAVAVVASYRDLLISPGTLCIGELGLGGQLRPVARMEQRLQEGQRLGFHRALVPTGSEITPPATMTVIAAGTIRQALVAALQNDPAGTDKDTPHQA
ncbi:DNA repair protein RadA [Candidatus Synechococcus spongiarum]|uniref:DNA repair protein RadA n=1 Tax=Candidatus Synechococcus spongiarum TaxID=431041 RepID=A0A164YZE0_9SYNE|nr:DNA repair protein RadA [Candidatus Synechococcus spongiarum]SAY40011.1 DNA repair protein RadA [Candidatus Synechococcus spongiarum]